MVIAVPVCGRAPGASAADVMGPTPFSSLLQPHCTFQSVPRSRKSFLVVSEKTPEAQRCDINPHLYPFQDRRAKLSSNSVWLFCAQRGFKTTIPHQRSSLEGRSPEIAAIILL